MTCADSLIHSTASYAPNFRNAPTISCLPIFWRNCVRWRTVNQFPSACSGLLVDRYSLRSGEGGIRHSRENPEETTHFAKGGAESGANDPENKAIDPGLALVVERWDSLPDAVRV